MFFAGEKDPFAAMTRKFLTGKASYHTMKKKLKKTAA